MKYFDTFLLSCFHWGASPRAVLHRCETSAKPTKCSDKAQNSLCLATCPTKQCSHGGARGLTACSWERRMSTQGCCAPLAWSESISLRNAHSKDQRSGCSDAQQQIWSVSWTRSPTGINQSSYPEIIPAAARCTRVASGVRLPSSTVTTPISSYNQPPALFHNTPALRFQRLPPFPPPFLPSLLPPELASLCILARRPILQTENIKAYLWLDLLPTLQVCWLGKWITNKAACHCFLFIIMEINRWL